MKIKICISIKQRSWCFPRLSHPDRLINSTISRFIAVKASDQPVLELPAVNTEYNELDPVCVVLPFKRPGLSRYCSSTTQRSEPEDSSNRPAHVCQPTRSNKHLKLREVNQQSLVYKFKCDLCNLHNLKKNSERIKLKTIASVKYVNHATSISLTFRSSTVTVFVICLVTIAKNL